MADKKRRKAKKKTDFKSSEQRSVFLNGKPNREKRVVLAKIQADYTTAVNYYAKLINTQDQFLLPLLNRDRKNSELRAFEKVNRHPAMNAALGQSAFDYAVDMLATRAQECKSYAYEHAPSILTSSKVLYADCVNGKSRADMEQDIQNVIMSIQKAKNPDADKIKFYESLIRELRAMDEIQFRAMVTDVLALYKEAILIWRLPEVRKAEVRLTSMLFTLEKSEQIKAPYVIRISNPAEKRVRIEVPLNTSKNSLRRLDQYGAKNSVAYTIQPNGKLRVTVAFEKMHQPVNVKSYRGVDVGIRDMLFTSDGQQIGTFKKSMGFYEKEVMPLLSSESSIRNKKRSIRRYLRAHPNLPADVKKHLRDKMDHLETMLRRSKKTQRKTNEYHNRQERDIKLAVKAYIDSLHGDRSICTVLELLDIREFEKSRKANNRLSMFARGSLSKKLMDSLNWEGYPFMQIEPAYTSQCCPNCSYTSKENRNEKLFQCKCCGYQDDADHVGSLNIAARAEDDEITDLSNSMKGQPLRDAIHAALDRRHAAWKKSHQTTEACSFA